MRVAGHCIGVALGSLFLLAFAIPLAARGIEIPSPSQRWLMLREGEFTIISNESPARTMQIAYEILGLRRSIQELIGPVRVPLPTKVFIFATARTFAPYRDAVLQRKTKNTGAAISNDNAGDFFLIQADDRAGIPPFIPHQLTHELIDNAHPALPLWFREGLAEYYTSYRVFKRQPQLGRPLRQHVQQLKNGPWIAPLELFTLDATSPLYDEDKREGMFYAESWLLVHTLLKGKPRRRADLAKFIAFSDKGPASTAFVRAFDLSPEDLAIEAEGHFRQLNSPIHIPSLRSEMAKLDELPAPKAMPRDGILFELGHLLATSSEANASIAERFVAKAVDVNPLNARAHALRGRLQDQAGHREAAAKSYREALRLGSDDSEVLLLCASSVMQRFGEHREIAVDEILRVRPLFEKATRLDPDSTRAWIGLGTTYVQTADDPAPGIAAFEKARALEPTNDKISFYLVELLVRDPERMGEARALAASLYRRTAHSEIRDHLKRLLPEMEGIEQEDLVLRGIQLAKERVNEGGLEEALRILDEILPSIEDGDLLTETRKWRTEIEQRMREKQ